MVMVSPSIFAIFNCSPVGSNVIMSPSLTTVSNLVIWSSRDVATVDFGDLLEGKERDCDLVTDLVCCFMVVEPPCCKGLAFTAGYGRRISGIFRNINQAADTVFPTEKSIEKRFQPLTRKIRVVSKFVNAICKIFGGISTRCGLIFGRIV